MDVSCQPHITTVLSSVEKNPFGSLTLGGNGASLNTVVANRKFSAFPRNGTFTIDPVFLDCMKLLRYNQQLPKIVVLWVI